MAGDTGEAPRPPGRRGRTPARRTWSMARGGSRRCARDGRRHEGPGYRARGRRGRGGAGRWARRC